ncbi:hypothetical protein WA026_002504 [Henosepilachna vigintioctopunctata]|uniref:Uncharacterized protein n=1 Tax=Henosepilachna vigintioctopunctata TaxID=420089 RepID=A0AAW1U0K3_9CUCU
MVEPIFDYQFRLILIEDSTVGKSCLLKPFTDEKFSELSDPTLGVDFFACLIEFEDEAHRRIEPHRPVFALVDCKVDLTDGGQRDVPKEDAKLLADQHRIFHVETSAKLGWFVEVAFRQVTQEIYSRVQNG